MKLFRKIFNKIHDVRKDDAFLRRLPSLTIGEGMLCKGNIDSIKYVISDLQTNGCVLEIGSYGGRSTNLITYLLNKYNKKNLVFTCDAWIYESYNETINKNNIDGRSDINRKDYSIYMKNAFIETTKFLSKDFLPHTFHLCSNDFLKAWKNEDMKTDVFNRTVKLGMPISFAYIDGDHSYASAFNDFKNIANFLLVGGYILLDDSAEHLSFGSAKMMKEILADKRFTTIKKNPNYLIKKIKN